MDIYLYLDKDTVVHRLDPRTKLTVSLILFAACLCFNHPLFMAAVSAGVGFIAWWAQALIQLRRLRYLLFLLVAFSSLLWPFFLQGPTLWWSWGPLSLSRESVLYGLAMGLRLATFVAVGLIFLSTTRNEELTGGLILMGIPYPLAFALSTALRLVPTFAGAGATIIQAQVSRGLDLETGSLIKRIGTFIPQAVPLFIYAVHHTNTLAMALESKGFDPKAKRSFYYHPEMKAVDYGVIVFFLLLLGGLLYLRLVLGLGVVIKGRF